MQSTLCKVNQMNFGCIAYNATAAATLMLCSTARPPQSYTFPAKSIPLPPSYHYAAKLTNQCVVKGLCVCYQKVFTNTSEWSLCAHIKGTTSPTLTT
jgi:hypothetical protein